MAEDPLEALARATTEGSQASFRARIDKERRLQNRSRLIRRTLRWSILGLGSLSFALMYFGSWGWQALGVLGMLITLMLIGVLFIMGGVAPMQLRAGLSKRNRKLLDD